jgi:DNA-binding NarL/FixJ family response regulator/class 3 adenylate cyclase
MEPVTGTTTILVTDLATSTEQLTAAGDDAGVAELTAHLRLVREIVERHGGRVAKTLGDGVMALFSSAYDATRVAIALQQQVERANRHCGVAAPTLRVGANVGEVVDAADGAGEDVFGAAVVLAHRLCAVAEPGEIVVSDLVRMLVGTRSDVAFESCGDVKVKGFDAPVGVAHVLWEPLPDETPTRVVVADDAALVRSGIVRLLADEGFELLGEAADAETLIELVDSDPPDLVITDIRMPPAHRNEGLRAAAEIRSRHPEVAVLVLSQHVEVRAAANLLDDRAAGVGYLLKERVGDVEEFLAACRTVAEGGRVVDPIVSEDLLAARRAGNPVQRLTERERDVLGLMAQGKSNAAIGQDLTMSPKTVESHVRSIFMKLDLAENPDEHRRVAAVVRWLHAHD